MMSQVGLRLLTDRSGPSQIENIHVIVNLYQIVRREMKQSAQSYDLLNYTCIVDESGHIGLPVPMSPFDKNSR